MHKKSITGCRPHSLIGAWAIEQTRFRQMYEIAVATDLRAIAARRAEMMDSPAKEEAEEGYEIIGGGIARIDCCGPFTKYVTSFDEMFGCTCTLEVRRAIRAARTDTNVRGLLIRLDSPGGTVDGTPDLADELWAFSQEKPVVAYCEDLACSAAYWVAAQADLVFANANAEVGNIGCYSVLEDTTGMQEKTGIKLRVVSTGPAKGLGADGVVSEALVADVQRRVDCINDLFIAAVARGRESSPEAVRMIADGKAYTGQAAADVGLIDGVCSLDDATLQLMNLISADSEELRGAPVPSSN